MGYRMVTWTMTSRDLERSNSWPQYAERAISRKVLELETSNLVGGFVLGMPSRRTNNFPESGRGLGHVTPTIFSIQSNISLQLLELETSNLIHGFVWAMPSRRTNKFQWKSGRGLGHVTPTIFGSTVGYPSDSLASCLNIQLSWHACLIQRQDSRYFRCPVWKMKGW